jgi:DNA-binding MarR family transcriptional regulator
MARYPNPTTEPIERRPGYVIRRLHQIADGYYVQETAGLGITPVQYGALLVIQAHPGIDQLRLGQALRCDRTTISGVVRRLQAKSLIRRRTGKTDRRAKALFVTPNGAQMIKRLVAAATQAERRILTGLSATERRQALELLARVVRLYEEKNGV